MSTQGQGDVVDNAAYLREWAADIRKSNGKSVDADRLDSIAAEIDDLKRAARNRDMWKGQCERQADELTRLRALLSSSRGEQGWRTMDSAPKDGTHIIGNTQWGAREIWWHKDTYEGEYWTDEGDSEPEPTGWIPMPGSVPTSAGSKILEGLRDAVAGDLPRVTIEGVTYVRQDSGSPEALLAASRQDGYVLVPKAAIRWLLGDGPDANGNYFGDEEAYNVNRGRYWWRNEFRHMLQSSPQPTAGGDAPASTNKNLNSDLRKLADVWELDGDLMRCRGCGRALIASLDGEALHHSAECKHSGRVHPWVELRNTLGAVQTEGDKNGTPTQRYQWCSYVLKIEPGIRWLAENDPGKTAICLVGARRAEAADPVSTRATFPEYLARSENHGGRMMLAPMVTFDDAARDALLARAGIAPLPHRSGECKCINSNKADMRRFSEGDIAEIEDAEREIGRPMFRPHRHLGATGIREVIRWAHSPRGKYEPEPEAETCNSGWCEQPRGSSEDAAALLKASPGGTKDAG